MLTELSQTVVGRDTVTLYQTDTPMNGDAAPHDGYRDRYVFDVTGPRISGLGAVGAQVSWVMDGRSWKRQVDQWEPGATPRVDVWVDAHTLEADAPDGPAPITLNGVAYRHGMTWHGDRLNRSSVSRAHDYGRLTPAADARLTAIFGAVRDLFLALPDAERATIRRALEDARSRAEIVSQKAAERADDLTAALLSL